MTAPCPLCCCAAARAAEAEVEDDDDEDLLELLDEAEALEAGRAELAPAGQQAPAAAAAAPCGLSREDEELLAMLDDDDDDNDDAPPADEAAAAAASPADASGQQGGEGASGLPAGDAAAAAAPAQQADADDADGVGGCVPPASLEFGAFSEVGVAPLTAQTVGVDETPAEVWPESEQQQQSEQQDLEAAGVPQSLDWSSGAAGAPPPSSPQLGMVAETAEEAAVGAFAAGGSEWPASEVQVTAEETEVEGDGYERQQVPATGPSQEL